MNVKVAVVVLVAIVVVVVLALFYGSVRPAGAPDAGRGTIESALGWLRSTDRVTFEDLARQDPPCLEESTRTFVVVAGSPCRMEVPAGGTFALCASENRQGAQVAVVGESYPAQRFDDARLRCEEPASVDVYDGDSVLELHCLVLEPCRFVLEEPAG